MEYLPFNDTSVFVIHLMHQEGQNVYVDLCC